MMAKEGGVPGYMSNRSARKVALASSASNSEPSPGFSGPQKHSLHYPEGFDSDTPSPMDSKVEQSCMKS